MMEIIPVIDLMAGHVVHARFGNRQHYQPIQSLLCNSSKPVDIIQALLELYPFKTIYIADIDAIQGPDNHFELVVALAGITRLERITVVYRQDGAVLTLRNESA